MYTDQLRSIAVQTDPQPFPRLKGHTKIELFDQKSGRRETFESDNMVTDAVRTLLQPLGPWADMKTLLFDQMPYAQTLFGGLVLFDTAIPEAADRFFPPASAQAVGYGAYGETNGTGYLRRGSFNANESAWDGVNHRMTYVYDFTTAQANGTIAAACLTHKMGGFSGWGDPSIPLDGATSYSRVMDSTMPYTYLHGGCPVQKAMIAFDSANDCFYAAVPASTTTLSIRRYRGYARAVPGLSVDAQGSDELFAREALLDSRDVALPAALPSASRAPCWMEAATKTLWLSTTIDKVAAGASWHLLAVSLADPANPAVTDYPLTNNTGKTLTPCFCVTGGYALVQADYPGYSLFKIRVDAPTDVAEIAGPTTTIYPARMAGERVLYALSYSTSYPDRQYLVNPVKNTLENTELGGVYCYPVLDLNASGNTNRFLPFLDNPLRGFCLNAGGPHFTLSSPRNYLATVNNLATPVTKTADKTMKVTYLLQEA